MGSLVLFHIILARERLVACRASDVLLARVLLPMACCVARGGESIGAARSLRMRTWVLFLLLVCSSGCGGVGGGRGARYGVWRRDG